MSPQSRQYLSRGAVIEIAIHLADSFVELSELIADMTRSGEEIDVRAWRERVLEVHGHVAAAMAEIAHEETEARAEVGQ